MNIVFLPTAPKPKYVVAVGTPFAGLTMFGPFQSKKAAEEWGDQCYPIQEWHVLPLERTDQLHDAA